MCFLHLYACPAAHVPPAQLTITAPTHNLVTTWRPGQRRNPHWMLRHDTDVFPAVGVPDKEFSSVAVAAARGYPPGIEAPGHTCNDSLVSHQPEQQPVTPAVPDIYAAVFAYTHQPT